jgi:hypothetical protein
MALRGYTVDPNLPVRKSSARRRWVYLQNYEVIQTTLPSGGDIGELFNKEFSQTCGTTSGVVDHTFAAVKVVEDDFPIAGLGGELIDLGELAINSDGIPVLNNYPVDPSELDNYDGWFFNDPTPKEYHWDGGSFAQWNLGVTIDGLTYRIMEDGSQRLEVYKLASFEDGALVEADGDYAEATFLEVTRAQTYKDVPNPARVLGQINYEVVECVAVITDWSHYNWPDDTPIRKAFKALINGLPNTVTTVYVPSIETGNSQLKTSPDRALWTSLGFIPQIDTSEMLIYSPDNNLVPY